MSRHTRPGSVTRVRFRLPVCALWYSVSRRRSPPPRTRLMLSKCVATDAPDVSSDSSGDSHGNSRGATPDSAAARSCRYGKSKLRTLNPVNTSVSNATAMSRNARSSAPSSSKHSTSAPSIGAHALRLNRIGVILSVSPTT